MNHKLSEILRITLTHPVEGSRVTKVSNDDYIFSIDKQKNNIYNRKKLETQLRFTKEDYIWLKAIDDDQTNRCYRIDVKIEINDKFSGNFLLLHEGQISTTDMQFNNDDCVLLVSNRTKDGYTVLDDNLKVKVNLLEGATTVEVRHLFEDANLVTVIQDTFPSPLSPPVSEGWVLTKLIEAKTNGANNWFTILNLSEYSRFEKVFTTPPPIALGWIQIGATTTYFKQPRNRQIDEAVVTIIIGGEQRETIFEAIDSYQDTRVVNNGIQLNEVITKLFQETNYTVISNFFGINADNTAPTNDAYTYAANNLQNLVYFLSNSVSVPNTDEEATKYEMTIEEFQEQMLNQYQVVLFVDESQPNTLRIEHVSYIENQGIGLDLTTYENGKYIVRKNRYEYLKEEIPISENWGYAVESDFDGLQFDYNEVCANESKDDKPYIVKNMVVDYLDALFNEDKYGNKLTIAVATVFHESERHIINAPIFFAQSGLVLAETLPKTNGALSFFQLQKTCWLHQRPQTGAIWNGNNIITAQIGGTFQEVDNITFASVKKNKRQIQMEVGKFDYQKWINLDVNKFTKTQISEEGESLTLTWSLKNSFLTIVPVH